MKQWVIIGITLGAIFALAKPEVCLSRAKRHVVPISIANSKIPEYTLTPILVIGEDDSTEATKAALNQPGGVCVDWQGNIFVLDAGNKRVVKFDQDGNYLQEFGKPGQGPGEFREPLGMAMNLNTGNLYISDHASGKVEVFSVNGVNLKSYRMNFLSVFAPNLFMDNAGDIIIYQLSGEGFMTVLSPEYKDPLAIFGVLPELERPMQKKSWDFFCYVAVTPQDDFFVFFRFHPILQKYDKYYQLLFTKNIRNMDIMRLFLKAQEAHISRIMSSSDEFTFVVFCHAIFADYLGGCYASIRNKIYYFNNEGKEEKILHLKKDDGSENIVASALFIDESNYLYAVDSIDMKVYKFSLNKT